MVIDLAPSSSPDEGAEQLVLRQGAVTQLVAFVRHVSAERLVPSASGPYVAGVDSAKVVARAMAKPVECPSCPARCHEHIGVVMSTVS